MLIVRCKVKMDSSLRWNDGLSLLLFLSFGITQPRTRSVNPFRKFRSN